MRTHGKIPFLGAATVLILLGALPALGAPRVQCPAGVQILTQNPNPALRGFDPHNPANSRDPGCRNPRSPNFYSTCKVQIDPVTGQASGATTDPTVLCRSIACGDGHIKMADGSDIYIFGFADVTNVPEAEIMTRANPIPIDPETGEQDPSMFPLGAANFSAPTFFAAEGQQLYLTLTNTGFRLRPDLFDPHTVHYHGFPNAASVFDGEPMASLSIGLGESLSYYYNNQFPGTFMWHCHVEAAEHMQMGMLGNLYITPRQDAACRATPAPAYCFKPGSNQRWAGFAYNDGDGSTGYDKVFFLQETAFDPVFHHADESYQKIPFADMNDTYAMLNGRGYPDTVKPDPIINMNGAPSQPIPAIAMTIEGGARTPTKIFAGDRVLLRLSSLSTVEFFTVTLPGIPMRVVGQGAQQLLGPTGVNNSYATGSITLGGGEGVDLILDTTGVQPGTYFLYTTNLNRLSNDAEDYGGMMTEIVVSPR
jgi:FtsP/CotA-like multicopper oxidase with cupredoxin domain